MPYQTRAFTLMELLVSAAIIAVLILFASATMEKTMDASRSAKCMSNLRQIGVALAVYVGDNGGKLLPRYANDVPAGEPKGWPARLFGLGYVDNPDLFFCPSFFPRNNREATFPVQNNASQAYGMRVWAAPGVKWGDDLSLHKPVAIIDQPSKFFIVADSVWLAAGWYSQGYGITPGSAGQFVHLRHGGRANTLFLDGHVEQKNEDYFAHLGDADQQGIYNGGKVLKIGTTSETDRAKLQNP